MTFNLANINVWKMMQELSVLRNCCIDVATVQETHFIYKRDNKVMEPSYVIISAFGYHFRAEVSMLIGYSLDADVNGVILFR